MFKRLSRVDWGLVVLLATLLCWLVVIAAQFYNAGYDRAADKYAPRPEPTAVAK